jgi:hypothetical protein
MFLSQLLLWHFSFFSWNPNSSWVVLSFQEVVGPRSISKQRSLQAAAEDTIEQKDRITTTDFTMLLDESVLLYHHASDHQRHKPFASEMEQELWSYRIREITTLLEDVVMIQQQSYKGSTPPSASDDSETSEEEEEESVVPTTTLRGSLTEISKALDHAILESYQSNFSSDEMEFWVRHIQSLNTQLVQEIKSLPPAAATIPRTTVPTAPAANGVVHSMEPTRQQFWSRLEALRVLIDPMGDSRRIIPLARSQSSMTLKDDAAAPVMVVENVVKDDLHGNKEQSSKVVEEAIHHNKEASSVIPADIFFATVVMEPEKLADQQNSSPIAAETATISVMDSIPTKETSNDVDSSLSSIGDKTTTGPNTQGTGTAAPTTTTRGDSARRKVIYVQPDNLAAD